MMGNINHKEITERVISKRGESRVTDYYIWKNSSIPRSTYYKMIKNESDWKMDYLLNIAKLFQVSFNWLVFGDEDYIKKEILYEIKELKEENLLLREELSDYRAVKDIIIKAKTSKTEKIKERS